MITATNATASTSTVTGAVKVTGGLGVGGAAYVGSLNATNAITCTQLFRNVVNLNYSVTTEGGNDRVKYHHVQVGQVYICTLVTEPSYIPILSFAGTTPGEIIYIYLDPTGTGGGWSGGNRTMHLSTQGTTINGVTTLNISGDNTIVKMIAVSSTRYITF